MGFSNIINVPIDLEKLKDEFGEFIIENIQQDISF